MVGWVKLNGGCAVRVDVVVVTVLPLVVVVHTPLLGLTVWATTGPAKGSNRRTRLDNKDLVSQFKSTKQ